MMGMKQPILSAQDSYTFADYFKLAIYTEEILAYFGYRFERAEYQLPSTPQPLDRIEDLDRRLRENRPFISLSSETARREFLIAPVLMEVIHYTHSKLRVEYPLNLNEQLKGSLDYYLEAQGRLLVIEAKNADLESGFTQLAVELIALDQSTESESDIIYGAVSTGNLWQFGLLQRGAKTLIQDLNLFRVPADLHALVRVLVAVMRGEQAMTAEPSATNP
jgi:hypothetical protein